MKLGICARSSDGVHHFRPHPDRDAAMCACGAELSGIDFALIGSRRRIENACTEPGNQPAGAPYQPNAGAVVLPVLTNAGVRALVEERR